MCPAGRVRGGSKAIGSLADNEIEDMMSVLGRACARGTSNCKSSPMSSARRSPSITPPGG